MRLVMYLDGDKPRLGAVTQGVPADTIIDLRAAAAAQGRELHAASILELIDLGEDALREVRNLMSEEEIESASVAAGHIRPLEGTELLPPLGPPRGNVLAIGHNYMEHAQESARARGEEIQRPTVFTKAHTSINSPYGDIPLHPEITQQVDWEVELGVVIGRSALNVAREEALSYVFGYTVVNDVSARDLQFSWGGQFFKGKSLDGFCPTGPWIVTADEILDPQNLHLWLTVNGERMQDSNTSDMIFPVAEIITQLSQGMTLVPGALIATGTPAGVGMGREPQVWLKEGDEVEAGVDGIGVIRNRCVR